MARTEFKIQGNNFTGGLVTEASPLSFPANSCLDILNMDINVDGSVTRRQGLQVELNGVAASMGSYLHTYYDQYITTYIWRNAAGIPQKNFVVVKIGEKLEFFEETDSLSPTKKAVNINLLPYAAPSATNTEVVESAVSITDVKGILVVTSSHISPFTVEYNSGTDSFTATALTVQRRDLEGLTDIAAVDNRPTDLTDEHYYNLLNQGWDSEKIEAFHKEHNRYPSNADIWSAGRDADNEFDPKELVKIDFGTSPAPKGRFIQNVFDNISSFTFGVGDSQVIESMTRVTALDPTMELTITGHGYTGGETIYIGGNLVLCGGAERSLDGVYTVLAGSLTVDTFRIQYASPACSTEPVEVTWGKVYDEYVEVEDVGISVDARPTAVASFAGRVFYAGVENEGLSDTIFFSQIVSEKKNVGRCYSQNDPTSEIDPDIIATDGGTISIPGLGTVLDMREQQQALVVFTTSGVWEIKGEADSFFNATGYMARKVTSVPVISTKSVVNVEGSLFFLGEDAIYVLQPNDITGHLVAQNLTDEKVKSYYINTVQETKEAVSSVYDYKNKKILWAFGTAPSIAATQIGIATSGKERVLRNVLVLDLRTQSFTKYSFPFQWSDPVDFEEDGTARIMHAFSIRNIEANTPAIKWLYIYPDNSYSFLEMSKERKDGFSDIGLPEQPSYIYTGHATLDDIGAKKNTRQLILHMLRTEEGLQSDDVETTAIHPSSCKVRIAWDFTNDESSNKWLTEFQGYRYRQLYMPSTPGDKYNTGHEVLTSKTKLRGTGRALSLRFTSEEGKDMHILGWSIIGSMESHE